MIDLSLAIEVFRWQFFIFQWKLNHMPEKPEKARFVRVNVLKNSGATFESITGEWNKLGLPKTDKIVLQHLYQARSTLKIKYNINDMNEIPRTPNGKLDEVGLCKLLLKKNPKLSEQSCRERLATDGVELTSDVWKKASYPYKVEKSNSDQTPDSIQETEPRMRFRKRAPRKSSKKAAPASSESDEAVKKSIGSQLAKMEAALDELIASTEKIGNSSLVSDLRDARRRISRGILNIN
jgi:hypothetical protein